MEVPLPVASSGLLRYRPVALCIEAYNLRAFHVTCETELRDGRVREGEADGEVLKDSPQDGGGRSAPVRMFVDSCQLSVLLEPW